MSNDAIITIIAALVGGGGVGALVDRFLLRRPVTDKLAAETRAMDANTTDTIASIVKGLLVTMKQDLKDCAEAHDKTQRELDETKEELDEAKEELRQVRSELDEAIEQIADLTMRLTAAEQEEQ